MPKVKLIINLNSPEGNSKYEVIGSLNKDKKLLTYFEPTEEKTKVEYSYGNKKLTRTNIALNMIYTFDEKNETKGIINIKDLNKQLCLKLKTIELKQEDYNVKIKFQVENQKFIYDIKVKES